MTDESPRYVEPDPRPRALLERQLNDANPEVVIHALLSAAYHDPDAGWVEAHCRRLAGHPDVWVRRNAAACLGHLARIHRTLDLASALPVLERLAADPETRGWAEDALSDLRVFLPPEPPRS